MEFLLLFALATSLAIVQGEECMPLEDNPCVFKCNGTTFDLSNLFDYPWDMIYELTQYWCVCVCVHRFNITGPYGDLYVWNPCTGMNCPPDSKTDSNAAVSSDRQLWQFVTDCLCCQVCQSGFVDCGQNDRPVFLLQQRNPYMFKVEYPNGMTWRWLISCS